MDDKKKIVLGSEDFLAKGIDDIYININLQQTFNQIKKDKYDNNFDLAEQFRKERNASRSFRIYGIVDSTITNSDNLTIRVYKDSGLTQIHSTIKTSPLAYDEDNVFDKRRGKYLLELNNYDADLVYLAIQGDGFTYADQVFEQRLVFYTLDGEFVEYGTETVDVGINNPGFLEIENDFPFFYDKHWIKKDLGIVEEKLAVIEFSTPSSIVSENDSITFEISMDKPSPFGNESVEMDVVLGTALPADYNITLNGNPVSFPTTLNWTQGEQNKVFAFDGIADDVYEFSENLRFDLYNFSFVESGLTTSHFVQIEDATPRKITRYNFGEFYKNRLEFSGRTAQYSPATLGGYAGYAILRNGLYFQKEQLAFYPGDTYQVVVTNEGIDTLLPVNPKFGINSEQIWPAGTDKIFNVDTEYDGNEKHKVRIVFPSGAPPNRGNFRINGVDMPITNLTAAEIANRIVDGSAGDWITSNGFEKDFTAVQDSTTAITITSKSVGLPVIIDIEATSGSGALPFGTPPIIPGMTPFVVEIDPYVKREQVPRVLTLYANSNSNTKTRYSFQFIKQGYEGPVITAKTQVATASGVDRYLVSTFDKISRNWSDTEDDCLYFTGATPEVGYPLAELPNGDVYPGNYLWPVDVAHINGSVFLQSNTLNSSKQNFTEFRTADFKNYPLIVEPCTNEDLAPNSVSQVTTMTIPGVGQGSEVFRQLHVNNSDSFRSFDVRTGTTGPYTTFYKSNPNFFTSGDIKWNNSITTSGLTSVSGKLGAILDLGSAVPLIPSGPFIGTDLSGNQLPISSSAIQFNLTSKTPGVPFEITNIVNAYTQTTDNSGFFYVFAGNIVGGPITVETIVKNAIAGVDPNVAKNWMGGYNTDLQIGFGGSGTSGPATGIGSAPSLFTTL